MKIALHLDNDFSERDERARRSLIDQLYPSVLKCAPDLIANVVEVERDGTSLRLPDLISCLEQFDFDKFKDWPHGPKKPAQFCRSPLKEGQLWKAHFMPRNMDQLVKNLSFETDQDWFERKVKLYWTKHEGQLWSEKHSKELAHLASVKAIKSRGQRNGITGEWLIFSRVIENKIKNKCVLGNRYLCYARHGERGQVIFDRAYKAACVYPEVSQQLAQGWRTRV